MNEWLSKMMAQLKEFWKSASVIKKVILFAVIAAVIIAVVVAARVSSAPATVRLFNAPVTNESTRDQILDRLSEENVQAFTDEAGYISVLDEKIARKMRSILISEGLTPSRWDPFADFYNRSWSTTDKEQNVKLKNAVTSKIQQQLEALDDISAAFVTINIPESQLFTADQKPVSASITLRLRNGSDLDTNKKRQKNLQRLVLTMVEGLTAENLTISDTSGAVLNDFEGMEETDRLSNVEKSQKIILGLETEYAAQVLGALKGTYGENRVRIANMKIDMDMSTKSSTKRIYTGVTIKPDNPDTPYDDSEFKDSLVLSSETVTKSWQGTGYNPEGPAGTEGQTPPVYADMSNVVGRMEETGVKQNNVVNRKDVQKEESPQIKTITVSVNIDGVWRRKYDEKNNVIVKNGTIEREYTPVSAEDLASAKDLVIKAVNSDKEHVSVTNIPVDHTDEFAAEDAAFLRKEQTRRTILYSLLGIAVILFAFIIFRFVNREIERRKRLREEEILRKQQAAREAALWEARDQGVEVQMSVEERKRTELQENAIAMAKEHPEDVAMLIRTWLMEE